MNGFTSFASKRVVFGILLAVAILWGFGRLIDFLDKSNITSDKVSLNSDQTAVSGIEGKAETVGRVPPEKDQTRPQKTPLQQASGTIPLVEATPPSAKTGAGESKNAKKREAIPKVPGSKHSVVGMAFVEAVMTPLDHELNKRFWGWRPNDILDFTDNVNNYQLGILEVTRRTAVILAERISRTGSTAAFDKNLENAMNWFMIRANRYWFPSAESKYKAGLTELKTYFKKLQAGEANFYTRTDNLIPLLSAYEDLLGSCDENLVKNKEKDGRSVSFFKADDYFFYAKGVASAMGTILQAIAKDFSAIVESRRGMEVLHHAIESCQDAADIHPWIITNSNLKGIFANHRANMAAPISHARFYVGVLIKTLST